MLKRENGILKGTLILKLPLTPRGGCYVCFIFFFGGAALGIPVIQPISESPFKATTMLIINDITTGGHIIHRE